MSRAARIGTVVERPASVRGDPVTPENLEPPVRIIAGTFRRRKLLANPGLVTRPITDRVKETVFESLPETLDGRRIADVFAGTGTLGLEALSRGAASGVFIENDRKAFALLRRNVSGLGVEEQVFCWRTDALKCSFRPKGLDHLLPYDLIFFDPPYRMIPSLRVGNSLFKALQRLARERVSSDHALLLLRTPENAEFDCPSAWDRERTIELSGMAVHLLRKSSR